MATVNLIDGLAFNRWRESREGQEIQMNAQQVLDEFIRKAEIEPVRSQACDVPAVCYCDNGHLGSTGRHMGDESELGDYGNDLELGSLITSDPSDDGIEAAAPIWREDTCVGFLVYDSQGLHYAEPLLAAPANKPHPLAVATGIDPERLDW